MTVPGWSDHSAAGPDGATLRLATPAGWSVLSTSEPTPSAAIGGGFTPLTGAESASTRFAGANGASPPSAGVGGVFPPSAGAGGVLTPPAGADGEEWRRLTRVARAAGAVLAGFGTAFDEDTGQLVSASLLLAPARWWRPAQEDELSRGPVQWLDHLPCGPVSRSIWLARVAGPLGPMAEVVVEFAVPTAEPLTLVLRTPALRHLEQLIPVFDAIAGSLRVTGSPTESVFG